MTREQIVREAALLPRNEQVAIAMDLCEIAGSDTVDAPLTEGMRQFLDRRMAEADADPTPAEPWDVLREKMLRGDFGAEVDVG